MLRVTITTFPRGSFAHGTCLLSLLTAAATLGTVVITSGPATATAPAAAPSAAAAGSVTAYTVDLGPDDLYSYDEQLVVPTGSVEPYALERGGVMVGGTDAALGHGRTYFWPPTGTPTFTPGTYALGGGASAVEVSSLQPGNLCTDLMPTGSLTGHEASYDENGVVTQFAGSASLTCDTGRQFALEMRWNSTVPVVRLVAAVNTASPSRTISVPVTTETTFGTATLTGLAEATIVSETCSGATVAAGGSCAIGLRATPTTLCRPRAP